MSEATELLTRWRLNPVAFVVENFGIEPDAWQRDVLAIFPSQDPNKIRIALQACAGPGKTAVLAWCGWNFMICYGRDGEHPKGAAVSVTWDNLRDNLWSEFKHWYNRSEVLKLAFDITSERIFSREHPDTWFLSARSFSKTADAEEQGRTLSGLHSKYVLILVDESGEIPLSVLKTGEQTLSNCEWGKILQAGNPTSHAGMLYAAASALRHQWHVVSITGDPDDPKRSPRINADWAREQIKAHGRDDPWVMAYILGQFPPASINALLSVHEVETAMQRNPMEHTYSFSQKRVGVDVARFGTDRTVIFKRQGLMSWQPVEMRNARSQEVAARVSLEKAEWGSEMEFIDDTGGYGSGVVDALIQAGHAPIGVNFAGKAINPRYFNKRSEMWFEMAEWIKRGGALPKMPELVRELTTPTYSFNQGKFRLEEKDQIVKRLGFSPDIADALACTFSLPEMPGEEPLLAMTQKRQKHWDYDPFAENAAGA